MTAVPGPRTRSPRPRPVRVYEALLPRLTQAQRVVHGIFIGACLGFMGDEALASLDASYYDDAREPTDLGALGYDDARHMRSGLVNWERSAVEEHFPPGGHIIITGAGAGREVHAVLAMGFSAAGYEPHGGLVSAGNTLLAREGAPPLLRRSARVGFPTLDPADGVVSGWGSYTHITTSARRIAYLRGARAVLPRGGPLLLSFWMLPGRDRYFRVVQLAARPGRRLTRGPAAERGDVLAPHFVHCFSRRQIEDEARAGGFTVAAFAETPYPHAVLRAV